MMPALNHIVISYPRWEAAMRELLHGHINRASKPLASGSKLSRGGEKAVALTLMLRFSDMMLFSILISNI